MADYETRRQGAAHYTAIVKAARALQAAFGPAWYVRSQGPIRLDDESEPEPDVAVVPGCVEDYGLLNLIDRVLEVYREPQSDSAAAFGGRYTRDDTLDPAVRVTPLAAPASSILVSQLLP